MHRIAVPLEIQRFAAATIVGASLSRWPASRLSIRRGGFSPACGSRTVAGTARPRAPTPGGSEFSCRLSV